MPSFQISVSPSRRAAGRFVNRVRRSIQKAFTEENTASGITQSDIARCIGVHRSVINREIRGQKDLTLGRVAELAHALGREINFDLVKPVVEHGENTKPITPAAFHILGSTMMEPPEMVGIQNEVVVGSAPAKLSLREPA